MFVVKRYAFAFLFYVQPDSRITLLADAEVGKNGMKGSFRFEE